ncbi:hypothetical protein AGMMS49940_15700 [Spirochaetia bacterium]|nr:hypothetical protein AGMMS4952_04650 [Spirochaetia bacterium]GHV74268.1 hypothetical protein AGMMS49940_15700 [Spirochaetia bacterium]
MKGKTDKLDDLSKVFFELTDDRRDTLILTAKKLLKLQKSNNNPNLLPIEEKKRAD